MEKEIWKEIPTHPGYYASTEGKIKSKTGRIINGTKINSGYIMVYVDRKRYLKHRLIAETFLSNPENLPCVNHKDECKSNNCVKNLEWCNIKYNNTYNGRAKRIGDKNKGKKRDNTTKQKLSESKKKYYENGGRPSNCLPIIVFKNGAYVSEYPDITTASRFLNMKSETSIINVLKGRSKTGYGYTFEYKKDS